MNTEPCNSTPYRWRKLTPKQREELLHWRVENHHPWHRPSHRMGEGNCCYHVTAACYEHTPIIGKSPERLQQFSELLLSTFEANSAQVHAWCLLPNHYHVLTQTRELLSLCTALGKLNGRTSCLWNGEDNARGRKVWCGVVDRVIRSDNHFWATLNYVHHNPVRHGYADRWQDWPFSSAENYLHEVGHEEAVNIWEAYPIHNYGEGWDDAKL